MRRSWVEFILDAIDRLPGPRWAAERVFAA